MTKTVINNKVISSKAVEQEGIFTLFGIFILEAIATMAFFHAWDIIHACAELWREGDLVSLDSSVRTALWFGFRKTLWNLVLSIAGELAVAGVCFGMTPNGLTPAESYSRGQNLIFIVCLIRCFGYILALFRVGTRWYSLNPENYKFRHAYRNMITTERIWIVFWVLVFAAVALIIYGFKAQRRNLSVALWLLIVLVITTVGIYLNTPGNSLSSLIWDIDATVESIIDSFLGLDDIIDNILHLLL